MAGDFSNDLSQWFREQAVRMRRTKWPNAPILSDELFLIFSRVPDTSTGPIDTTPADPDLPGINIPPVEDLNIPPLDLAFLDFPEFSSEPEETELPQTPDGGRQLQNEYQTIKREVVPGTVVSGSGDTYVVEIYPGGIKEYLDSGNTPDDRSTSGIESKRKITVTHPQMDSTSAMPAGTWVWVWRLVLIVVTETLILGPDGQIISKSTNVQEANVENVLMHPVWI